MKSLLKSSLATLILVLAFTSHATKKELIVAIDTAFVPFEFKQGDKHVGFDIDLWDAIAKKLKLPYVLKPMDFSGIIPALQSCNVDLAIAGIAITKQREEAIDFSNGYYNSGLLVMVRSDDNQIRGEQDLKGKIVAVKSGTASVDYAKANNLQIRELRQFPNIDNAYLELATKRADAVLHDAPNILFFIKIAGRGQFKTVGSSLEAQKYGIALPPKRCSGNENNDELREEINTTLQAIRNDGTYTRIYEKWFGAEPN